MDFKRIFKWGKKKPPEGVSRGSFSRTNLSPPDASIRSASPPPSPSVAVSALVFQPFVPLPSSEHRRAETAVTSVDSWTCLTALVDLLKQTPLLAPLAAAIDDVSWFVRAHEDAISTQKEYEALRIQFNGLFRDLGAHLSESAPPAMTTSMLNLCEAMQNEIRQLYGTQDRNMISRYIYADHDLDKITGCYRRIQGHLERVMLNASLNIWRTVDKQATEAQLGRLNPSLSAYFDSAEASIVQRRECAANTREQVLRDLNVWKDKQDGEKVCWINGMAGTGKTTIVNTLCSTLDKNHELGASFFCTRSIPACRDVKLILPTIAHQLARFSSPFRSALLQALEQDPEVHSKVPRVQFKRMILEPLQKVIHSLPRTVVVIDALDECDDGNGVEQILEMLLENAPKLPVKFLVSSRPELHIRERIRQSELKTQLVLHELDHRVVKADIETYLRVELASISTALTKDHLEALVERAGSLFIYAATVVRYIKCGDTLERLAAVLRDPGSTQKSTNKTKEIDRLYEVVFLSALDDEDLEYLEKERMQLVLRTVVCAQEPLTVDALAGLLNLRATQVTESLKPWWSVLHISESNASHRVSTLHASFSDYILDSNRSRRFACDARTHNGELAQLCLKRIERNLSQFNICDLRSSYAFDEDVLDIDDKVREAIPLDLSYACRYWAVHLSLCGTSDERTEAVQDFLAKRLLLCMEVLNLTNCIEQGIGQMERVVTWLQTTECSESTMLLARDARRFVTMFATSPVSQSTPHLYVSTLPSWPDHQPIAHNYSQQATGFVQIKGIGTTERQLGLLSLIPVGSEVLCVACSPNGRFFAASTWDRRILIWDAMSYRITIDPLMGHTGPVQAIAVSPDGARICSGSRDKTLCVWNSQNGQLVAGPLQGHTNQVWSVNYSPNGQWLASGSLDYTVRVWSTKTWQQTSLVAHDGVVVSVVFSPDSAIIAAGFGSLVHLWDPSSGQRIGEPLKGHTQLIRALVFLPDGKHLVSSSDDCTICVWKINSGELLFNSLQEHTSGVSDVTVSHDGRFCVSAAEDDTIIVWETQTWQTCALFRHTGIIRSLVFLADGSHLVSGSVDGNLRVWEVQASSDIRVAEHPFEGHSGRIRSVIFSPCGDYIISGSHDQTVCVWDSQSRQLMHSSLKGHKDWVLSVGVSADGDYIFSVSKDRIIYVWSKQTGELVYTVGPVETGESYYARYAELWPVAFIFNGRRVVCGSESGRIYMQDTNKPSMPLTGHSSAVVSIAFSHNGQSFASGSIDGALMLWDATGERLCGPITGHSRRVNSIAFSPNDTQVASGSEDLTIRLWSSLTGTQIGNPLHGHTGVVRCVAFSPSGNQLVSGSQDMTVRVWDVAHGQSIAVFEGHTDIVFSAAFSPDGSRIVSGSADMTIRLWNALPNGILLPIHDRFEDPPEPPGSTDIQSAHFTLDWTMEKDGWVRDVEHQLLLWLPPDLRSVLLRRQNTGLISRQGCIELDFSNARIGDVWETGFKAS